MPIPLYQVDAFTTRVLGGNPAAICPLERWLDDATLQALATENNLSETAFFVPEAEGYRLRWFTPATEVELCGHATLASAHVLFEHLGYPGERIRFLTHSGDLFVARAGGELEMDFPAEVPEPCQAPAALAEALGTQPAEVLAASDYLAVLADAGAVAALAPDQGRLTTLDRRGVIVTAPAGDYGGGGYDFVSRFFAPRWGVPEDPVTGSAHCALAPFWAERLGRSELRARQVSTRGGDVTCAVRGDRVALRGAAVTYLVGECLI